MANLSASAHCLNRLTLTKEEVISGVPTKDTIFGFLQQFLNEPSTGMADSSMNNYLSVQYVTDDIVAKSLTSILGACVRPYGLARSFHLLQLFGIISPESIEGGSIKLPHMLEHKWPPTKVGHATDNAINQLLINISSLETSINYKFNDRAYLVEALTHPSFPNNALTDCQQRLAFLGEHLIDMLITAYIYERCEHLHTGQLEDLRAALCKNVTLACMCVRYRCHVHMLTQNATLSEKIETFVTFQESNNYEVTDQVLLLIEESDVNMGEYIDVPKILGDTFAAIIAGIFIDTGNNISKTWNVLYGLMANDIHRFLRNVPKQVIERLQEYPGANPKYDEPHFEDDCVMINVRFTRKNDVMQIQGFGKTKDEAKYAAAKVALHKLMS